MKFHILGFFLFINGVIYSQDKVVWSIHSQVLQGNLTSVLITADIEKGWHIYSVQTPLSAGPIPISCSLKKNKHLKVKSSFVEKSEAIKKFDANFDSDVYIFEDEFLGEFNVKVQKDTNLSATITYMVCNKVMCLPPVDVDLQIKLNTNE